ncbi:MAG: YihY/virulence factor BrkB family protein [Sphaerochaetaceae bacterium]|nr:YihY/virulence factor BrkB family protein [Sphaerochaetaceae bacterium]
MKIKRYYEVLLTKFMKDQITILASGIVYNTLISVIPFISFLVTFLALFDALQPFYLTLTELFTSIFGTAAGGQLVSMIEQYSSNARSLGAVGLISFGITSILLINKVWSVVNYIYRSSPRTTGVMKRTIGFITTLILGVILLASYISVKSIFSNWFLSILQWEFYSAIVKLIVQYLAPWAIAWLFVFIIIMIAPSSKVTGASAGIGALCATVGMYITNFIFSYLVNAMFGLSLIYGSFAVIFLFLLWVYSVWLVILLGVEISYIHQYQPDKTSIVHPVSPAEQMANGINVMMVIGANFRDGQGETKIKDISDRLLMNEKQLFGVLEQLERKNYIIATNQMRTSFIPAQPLENLMIVDLAEALYGKVYLEQNLDTIGDSISSQIDIKGIRTLGNLSVSHLLERV